MYRFGFGLFVLAESMIFVTLISARFLLAGSGHPGALDQALAAVLTGIMVASLVPVRLAGRSAARGRMAPVPAYLLSAALLGAFVVAGVFYGWTGLGIPRDSRFGEVFYTATGFHAVHLVIGLAVMAGLAVQASRGRFTAASRFGLVAGEIYWWFLVVVWMALYVALYAL
jgi:heme/copper-type cytochrome/quinol oxidase subunit 3